jgi:hypothetical protein
MLNCNEMTNLCSDELERPLSVWERLQLKMHLLMCTGCSNYRTQMSALRAAMRAYADGRAVPDEQDEHRGV